MAKKPAKPMEKNDLVFTSIQLDGSKPPVFHIDKSNDLITWGKRNDYPKTIISLLNNHPEHSAIVKGKARYLSGQSIKPEQDLPIVQDFLKKANRFEDWHSLRKKCELDKATYGGFAIQVVTNIAGQPLEFYHIDLGKLRVSKGIDGVYYSDDWDKTRNWRIEKTFMPFYQEGTVYENGAILLYKDYNPSLSEIEAAYPRPEYSSAILDIETDVAVTKYFYSLVKNGFSAGHIISVFAGEVKPEVKEDWQKRFQEAHQGEDNAGKVAICFVGQDGKKVEITNIDSNNLDKQYQELSQRTQQKIITGHNVPGVLFKIKKDGSQLGNDRNEIDLAHELFINEYAKVEQIPFNKVIQRFCKIRTGIDTSFEVEQIDPIGKLLPLDNANVINALNALNPNIVADYIINHYGLKVPEGTQPLPAVANPEQVKEAEQSNVNEHIKNLTGRQRQNLLSILNKYNKKTYTRDQAMMLLKTGFNLTDEQAGQWLGVQMSSIKMSSEEKEQIFLSWVESNTIELGDDYELVSSEQVEFKTREDVIKFEAHKEIQLKDDDDYKKEGGGFFDRLVDKVLGKPKPPLKDNDEYENVVMTVYKYGLRNDQAGTPLKLDTTRPFCVKMIDATSGKKRLTFEAIDKLENDFDENAWDFRGGFYTKKGTNKTTAWCRHIWVAETYIKRVKK